MTEILGARIVENREVARATRWLVIETDEPPEMAYVPGHIVALYVPSPGEKWVRHPYTVSWAEGARIGVLYRVVRGGRTSPFMATMTAGDTLRLGGRFGEAVSTLVDPEAAAIVGVSTGSGVGPLHGFAARALPNDPRPITLLAGFRDAADAALVPELDALAAAHPHFSWRAALSRPDAGALAGRALAGRVTAHVGTLRALGVSPLSTHWHLIGNGAMAIDLRAGLLAGGVSRERVTFETYHNRGTSPDLAVVAAIAEALAR
jgi:ferredoxin-NADP reductase